MESSDSSFSEDESGSEPAVDDKSDGIDRDGERVCS